MPVQAAPIVVAPSGQFLGNDGKWSTFLISAGNPPQELHVWASTQVAATWAVAPNGCSFSDASNCTQARGGVYDTAKSSSWVRKDLYQLNAATNLGYSGNSVNGTYGFDTLGIHGASGTSTVSVDHQVVADITTPRFYVGSLGLNAAPISFSATDLTDTAPSLLSALKTQSLIPSLSFGYTAGASYKKDGVNGSLTLGGYDASRFTPNDVSFTFAPAKTRQLVASVQSITYSDSKGEQPLMTGGILALVDSTVPYMWLPKTACAAFENTFGISWDPIANLYTVNDTLHETLVKTNPSVIFEISNSLTGGPAVNITFPYASFDLEATYPVSPKKTKYFPLQRAADENAYTLGRVFFQEAFVIVNYESTSFSISQAVYDSTTPSHIVAIAPGASGVSPNPSSTAAVVQTSDNSSHSLGTGAIAGIAVAFVLTALITGVFSFFIRRRRNNINKRKRASELPGDDLNMPEKPPAMNDGKGSIFSEGDTPQKRTSIPAVTVAEVPMTPPVSPPLSGVGINEYYRPISPEDLKPIELPGAQPSSRSEISSPAIPPTPTELPSPDPQALRSELSTPEPILPTNELPTPDPSHQLPTQRVSQDGFPGFANAAPSPEEFTSRVASSQLLPSHITSSHSAAPPSVSSTACLLSDSATANGDHSALNSPRFRPHPLRNDSSDSEAPFTRDPMPHHPYSPPTRMDSSSSDIPLSYDRTDRAVPRPSTHRTDTNSSDQSDVSAISPQLSPSISTRPQLARSFPAGSASFVAVRPPLHQRLGSQDSDTWETRLEQNSASEAEGESPGPSVSRPGPGSGRRGQTQGMMHRRIVSDEEKRVREGLVRGGMLSEEPGELRNSR